MRFDAPSTTDLGIGSQRRIIAPEDAVVTVPPVIQPGVQVMSPTIAATQAGAAVVQETSFVVQYANSKNNTGALLNDQICSFQKGLWDIQINLQWGLTLATSLSLTQILSIQISNSVLNVNLAQIPLVTGVNSISYQRIRMLFRDITSLATSVPATAVGDTIFWWIQVNAQKQI